MADETQDESQKTEEPTHRKLEEAHRRGEFASSREISTWFVLLAGTLLVIAIVPGMARDLGRLLETFVEQPHAMALDVPAAEALARRTVMAMALVLALPFAVFVVAALAAGFIQHGAVFASDRLVPKLERISLAAGAKRLFSMRSVVEFAKGLVKILIVGAVAALLMMPEMSRIEEMTTYEVGKLTEVLRDLGARLMIGVLAVVTVIAVLDYLYQRMQFMRQMRMSRQEIRDELKQTEGDPQIRARLRQIRQERARRRMMAAVPASTVVVTNPTHFAVALKYELETMAAPVLVAKGVDAIALRIRAVAEDAKVPIVENPPLAQALYAGVGLDEPIPAEHYRAVAEIIGYVFRLQGKLKPRPAQGASSRPAAG